MLELSAAERAALAIAQDNLSFSATPYADIAQTAGLTEKEVLELFQRLKDSGAIRRFGASIRHQRAGWASNAMVAWLMSQNEADMAGAVAAPHPRVSHAYFRPPKNADWPYSFYTMVHGRSDGECRQTVEELARKFPPAKYLILRTVKELKKTSMRYFD